MEPVENVNMTSGHVRKICTYCTKTH